MTSQTLEFTSMNTNTIGKSWLEKNWPKMRVADVNWTMNIKDNDFSPEAKDYICNSGEWVKVNDENGGTYAEKVYYETVWKKRLEAERRANLLSRHGVEETKHDKTADQTNNKEKELPFYNGMDERNKTAYKVLATKGEAAAVKHMFTDDKTGRQLSYSEMRARYG